jgi:class 3 adenylate cyclase/tetratricopeptide (TPR) repeat protein
MPKHLKERIRSASVPAEGERKFATTLFVDIAGSTALIHDLDIEDADRFLDPALDSMINAVHRYEGTVTHTAGDGIMALFGAPIAHEDHAARACYAALDIQDAMRKLAAKVRSDFGLVLQVRIGINSGPVIVKVKHLKGDVWVEQRASGVSTHLASKLESLATPGSILVTRDTLALVEGFFHVGELRSVTIKDIGQPLEVCELKGVNTRIRIQAMASRGLSKFVGRQSDLNMLSRAAAQARAGQGQVVAFCGEAGVGKSRLFWEFTRSSDMQPWLVLEAGSVSYGKATSYLPIVDLLTRYFELHARDDTRRVREKIAGKLFALGEKKLLTQTSFFLAALGMGVEDEGWASFAPAQRQKQIFAALKQLLIRESQEQPLCVVFEDLHWIDPETQAFLDLLLESVPGARLLLLVNFRPEYESRWGSKSYYSQAALAPLPEESAEELLDALLGTNPELGHLKKSLVDATGGNPLFLEESVRSFIESGALTGSPGEWRPTGSLTSVPVPQTVRALLEARIDRLAPELKEILQCAAVIGYDIPQTLLEAVTGIRHDELEAAMYELQSAEFLYEKTLFPETEYTFKHAMTREVAYGGLMRERKMILHACAARALLALSGPRLDEYVERIAEHAEQGALWQMALEYLERSGSKAFALYANSEAAKFLERALQVLRRLPDNISNREQAIDIRFELRNALLASGDADRIFQLLQEMEPLVADLGDKLRSARYAAYRCNYHFLAGEQQQAIEFCESGLQMARGCGERRMEGELLYRLGQSYHALGEYRKATDLFERSLAFTSEKFQRNRFDLTVIPAVVSRTWLASSLTERGHFAGGMEHAKRALEIAEECEHPLSQVLGWLAVGSLLLRKGENEGAISALERGIALCDQWSLRVWRPRVASSLAVAYARAKRLDEGLTLAREALADAERMRLIVDTPSLLLRLGQSSLIAGCVEDALSLGHRALELAHVHGAHGDEAWARFLIGRAHWAGDPPALDLSQSQVEAALSLARECEAQPLVAFCNTTLGAVYSRRGEDAKAQEFATAAHRIYEELGMRPLPVDPVH